MSPSILITIGVTLKTLILMNKILCLNIKSSYTNIKRDRGLCAVEMKITKSVCFEVWKRASVGKKSGDKKRSYNDECDTNDTNDRRVPIGCIT